MVSTLSISNQPIDITPKELLERFKKGETPNIENRKDEITKELDMLSERYKQSVSVNDKRKLLDKEREMLFEELKNPELTLARNYAEIVYSTAFNEEVNRGDFDDVLRLMNVTGIDKESEIPAELRDAKITEEQIDILKDAYIKSNEESDAGLRVKDFITKILDSYKKENPELSAKISDTFNYLYENTEHLSLRENIKTFNNEHTSDFCLDKLKNDDEDYVYYLKQVIHNSDRKDVRVNKLISGLLKQDNLPDDIMRRAVLGAGKYRNDENFEILKKIALNKEEADIRKREFAIQSTALYLKDKPDEVKDIMSAISKENSIFAPLGRILSDKIVGNYHSQKDRELKYAGFDNKKIKDFKHQFKNFYLCEDKLSGKKINSLQLNTMPFLKQLKTLSKNKRYLIIGNQDTITRYMPDFVGQRYIYPGAILNSGSFYDAYDGLNTSEYNLMSAKRLGDSAHQNQVAHETGHTIHEMFDNEDQKIIEDLYKKAKDEDRILDYYANVNSHEYFAQGCDAYASYYKPHKLLVLDDPHGHTIYELMDKDPDLYKFIKRVLKKYH